MENYSAVKTNEILIQVTTRMNPKNIFAVAVQSLNCFRLFEVPWTVAHQTSLFMGFPRQEYWSGLPFPSPKDLLDPGLEPTSPASQTDSLPLSRQASP